MKQQKKFTEKGITLIALIITIIVLLILAGVTIAVISGNEGVLDKAQSAKSKTDISSAKEAAILKATEYIQEYYQGKFVNNDSSVTTYTTAGAYVAKQFETQTQSGNYYIKTDANTRDLKISLDASQSNVIVEGTIEDNGTITWSDEVVSGGGTTPVNPANPSDPTPDPEPPVQTPAQIAATVNSKIGKQVNYTVDAYNKPWRVFYADTNYVFLITTDNAISGHSLDGTGKSAAYSNADGVSSYGQTYNSVWWGKMSTQSSNERANAKATAYLCDPTNWTNTYAGGTFGTGEDAVTAPTGTFAVGGPTKELLIESWNEAIDNGLAPDGTVKATEFTASDGNVSDGGYAYNKPSALYDGNPITTSIVPLIVGEGASAKSYGLYNPLGTSGNSYWLASPSSYFDNLVCSVSYDGFVDSVNSNSTSLGVRPLVCIPTSSFDTTWIAN